MHGNCKCGHHICAKVLMVLAWLAAIGFWWASWGGTIVWNFDSSEWFAHAVVFSLLLFGTKFCNCCRKSKMMNSDMGGMCKHEGGCICGDCGRCK